MQADVEQKVRQFIEENFAFRENYSSLSDTASLLEAGLIDSTGILELLAFLESEFHLPISDAEVVPENFDSIRAIASYVASKQAAISKAR